MGKIKGWREEKQTQWFFKTFINESNKDIIIKIYYTKHSGLKYSPKLMEHNLWDIAIIDLSKSKPIFSDRHHSYEGAIWMAMNYMRSHPNG